MSDNVIILRDLTDEQYNNLTSEELDDIFEAYELNGLPYRCTVKSVLEENDIKISDLTDFILGLEVGLCNTAKRTDDHIILRRENSPRQDNIMINLNKSLDVPDVVIQIQVNDDFVHEEAYNEDGMLIYRA